MIEPIQVFEGAGDPTYGRVVETICHSLRVLTSERAEATIVLEFSKKPMGHSACEYTFDALVEEDIDIGSPITLKVFEPLKIGEKGGKTHVFEGTFKSVERDQLPDGPVIYIGYVPR